MTFLLTGIAILLLLFVLSRTSILSRLGDLAARSSRRLVITTITKRQPDDLEPGSPSRRTIQDFDVVAANENPLPDVSDNVPSDNDDDLDRLRREFRSVTDYRPASGRKYSLPVLLTISTAASMDGASALSEIVAWANAQPLETRARLGLGNRPVPPFISFYIALRDVDQAEVDAALARWSRKRNRTITLPEHSKPYILSLPETGIETNQLLRGVFASPTRSRAFLPVPDDTTDAAATWLAIAGPVARNGLTLRHLVPTETSSNHPAGN